MLILSAYAPRDLQTVMSVLRQALADGLTLAELARLVEARVPRPIPPSVRPRLASRVQAEVCPACGRGPLLPVRNPDGLTIMGCRLCRYSEVRP